MNIKYILILLLIFTMNTYAENELSKKEMKHIAKSEYSLHLENNKEEIKAAHRVIKKLKKELRRDKEFRGLIKASRKNPQLKSDVTAHVKRLFDESGVKFGYFSTYSIQSFNALVMGYEMMNGFQSSNFVEIGIGLGLSSGDGIIGCLLGNLGRREVGYNIGISARAVVIVGAQVGVFVGTNGVCFSLGYAKGLNISLGAGLLTLH